MIDMQAWSDERLIEHYYDHRDDESIGILLDRHEDRLWTVLRNNCRTQEDAEDVFQDTWEQLTTDKAVYRGTNNATFRTFLYAVALRTCRQRYAGKRLQLVTSAAPGDDEEEDGEDLIAAISDEAAGVEERLADEERKLLVRNALQQLSARQREVVTLQHYSDMSRREIAQAVDIGEESVKTHLAEAYKKLRQLLSKELLRG